MKRVGDCLLMFLVSGWVLAGIAACGEDLPALIDVPGVPRGETADQTGRVEPDDAEETSRPGEDGLPPVEDDEIDLPAVPGVPLDEEGQEEEQSAPLEVPGVPLDEEEEQIDLSEVPGVPVVEEEEVPALSPDQPTSRPDRSPPSGEEQPEAVVESDLQEIEPLPRPVAPSGSVPAPRVTKDGRLDPEVPPVGAPPRLSTSGTTVPPSPAQPAPGGEGGPPAPPPAWSGDAEVMPKEAVAVLDGQPISRLALYQSLKRAHGTKVFDAMIRRLLLRAEVKRRDIKISGEEVDGLFDAHIGRLLKNEDEAVTAEAFLKFHFDMGVAEYKEQIIWPELAVKRLLKRNLDVTEDDLFDYYNAHVDKYTRPEAISIRHILIAPTALTDAAPDGARVPGTAEWDKARVLADGMLQRVRAGADFNLLARTESHDAVAAERSGDLGFFSRGTYGRRFEDAAFSLKPGEVSDLVKTHRGFHILLLEERRKAEREPFGRIKDRVRRDYEYSITVSQTADLLGRLREDALREGRLRILDPDLQGQRKDSLPRGRGPAADEKTP